MKENDTNKELLVGANANQAENIVNALCISKKRKFNAKAKPHHRYQIIKAQFFYMQHQD